MSKKTLAIDFDDTISYWGGEPTSGVVEALTKLHKNYHIIIYTCRCNKAHGGSHPTRLSPMAKDMVKFLKQHNIPYDEIDMGVNGKPVADYYIDDRAIEFSDNWSQITKRLTPCLTCENSGFVHGWVTKGHSMLSKPCPDCT